MEVLYTIIIQNCVKQKNESNSNLMKTLVFFFSYLLLNIFQLHVKILLLRLAKFKNILSMVKIYYVGTLNFLNVG